MAEETSENSGTIGSGIGMFGEMPMDTLIATANTSGIIESVRELPAPTKTEFEKGKTYQLISVQLPYVMGRFYKCILSEGSYSWKDVSEVQVFDREVGPEEFFRLNGNEVQFKWIDATVTTSIDNVEKEIQFIKTEIQLVHLDATGNAKSVKTIFTESVKNSYPNGAVVIVDEYTADGIAQGKITLRALSTYVGRVYICNLTNAS